MPRFFSFHTAFLAAGLSILVASPALAQHDHEASPQQATASNSINPQLPTLFIVGDSTAHNAADLGWGDHLAPLFNTSQINVVNRAIAGRSSRSYIASGDWAALLATLKPGDYILIQLGRNVDDPNTPDAYARDMQKMIDESKAKGAIPMVVTPTVRNLWKPCPNNPAQTCIERDMSLRDLDIRIADEAKVYLIDMATLAANAFESMGQKEAATFFPLDPTHTNALGAEINANCVARAILVARTVLAAFEIGHD